MKSCVDLADGKRLEAGTASKGLVTPPIIATLFRATSPSDLVIVTGIILLSVLTGLRFLPLLSHP